MGYNLYIHREGEDGEREPVSEAEWEAAVAARDDFVRVAEARTVVDGNEIVVPGPFWVWDRHPDGYQVPFHYNDGTPTVENPDDHVIPVLVELGVALGGTVTGAGGEPYRPEAWITGWAPAASVPEGASETPRAATPAPAPSRDLDLFGALVRLEVEGWKTGPGRADLATEAPAQLARLLRKCAWLESPDGVRYDLTGELPAPDMDGLFAGRDVKLRRLSGTDPERASGVWLSQVGGSVRLWRLDDTAQGPRVTALASTVEEWLGQLVSGRGASGVVDPQPLPDLAEVGDGVGWRLADLITPVQLGRVPEEVADAPFELDEELLWRGQRVLPLDEFVTDTVPVDGRPLDEPDLDELFGQGGGRPRPRTGLIMTLLLSGLALTVLGMACIAAPGGILVLLAWMYVETDQQRLESGYLPASDAPIVERTRRFTYAGLVVVVFLFAVQGFLLCNGFYDVILDNVYIPVWQSFVRGLIAGGFEAAILPY